MVAQDSESVSSGSGFGADVLDQENEDGWEDVEPDQENIKIISLFSKDEFSDVTSMLRDCKERYNFDFLKVRHDYGLFICGASSCPRLSWY